MKKLLLLGVIAALGASARADIPVSETASFAGEITYDYATWEVMPSGSPRAIVDVYNNTSAPSAANAAFSSTALTSIWGDEVLTTGTGTLQEAAFTIFNSGASGGGALLTATVAVEYYRMSDFSFIGGFVTNPIVFGGGAGLAPNFFSVVTITGLAPEAIDIDVTDVLVLQTVTSTTGTANRLGLVSMLPVNIGSSPDTVYIDSPTVGAAGFYTLSSGGLPITANWGYRIAVPEPTSLALLAFGGLVALRRRK